MAYEEITKGVLYLLKQLEDAPYKKDFYMLYTALFITLKFVVKGDIKLMEDFTNMLVQYSKDVLDKENIEIH